MGFSLDELVVKFPIRPTRKFSRNGYDWEDYVVSAFYKEERVATITIARALKPAGDRLPKFLNGADTDSFFFDMRSSPAVPKPYIAFKETYGNYRGRGICGYLTCLVNEFYRGKLGTTLYSDTLFCTDSAKSVWKKLVLAGKAEYCPAGKQDRWRML